MELAPSLFNLEPPANYTISSQQLTSPREKDLIDILHLIAIYNDNAFPPSINRSKEYTRAVHAQLETLNKLPEVQKLIERLRSEYGNDGAGFHRALNKEWEQVVGSMKQTYVEKPGQGLLFYTLLKPQNDAHYAGKDVKLAAAIGPSSGTSPQGPRYTVLSTPT